jgi:hypothetical protein
MSQSESLRRNIAFAISSQIPTDLLGLRKHRNILPQHRLPREIGERYREPAEISPHPRLQRPGRTGLLGLAVCQVRPQTTDFMAGVEDYWSKSPVGEVVQ